MSARIPPAAALAVALLLVLPLGAPAQAADTLSAAFYPRVAFDAVSEQGGVVRFLLRSPSVVDSVQGHLIDLAGKQVAKAAVFKLAPRVPVSDWGGAVGVPSTLSPGTYRLIIGAQSGQNGFLQDVIVEIRWRSFLSEEIPLTPALTTLRTVPDPKKTSEAQELYRVLSTPHADSVFEWENFLKPLAPRRTSAFYGDRRQYRYSDSRIEVSVHNGMDYAADEGVPVAACGKGRVVLSAERILTGNTVVIEHLPGVFSLYYHMSSRSVKTGDVVEKGGLVGKVGHTGLATGAHLHWELQVAGVAVDPERLIGGSLLDKNPVFDSIFALSKPKGGD
jgi:hypothetical protein